jgi:hypothetical protein
MQRVRDLAQQDLKRYFGQERRDDFNRLFTVNRMMQLLRDVRYGWVRQRPLHCTPASYSAKSVLRFPHTFQTDARGMGHEAWGMRHGMHGPGPGSNESNQTLYRTFRGFSGHSSFRKEKVIRSCAHLMLVKTVGLGKQIPPTWFSRRFS